MKVITLLVATMLAGALAGGVAGCARNPGTASAPPPPRPSDADGARCGSPAARGPVHIEIRYAGDGTPAAVPATCTVAAGTEITWRGPAGDLVPFEIVFPAASPAWRDDRPRLMASEAGRHYKVRIKASDRPGIYKYGIKARGREIDPAIIIR